ncbi:MAG TPA: response regulator [Burkholderiaceae bacterium]|nr:response regulator [Burkholderiaceae bacterium]
MKRVLVVEDEYGAAEVLKLLLEIEGYQVDLAYNGEDALRQIERGRPDLIITDFMMPSMTGLELCAAVRNRADLVDVPIVLVSAVDEASVRQHGGDFDAFLQKPFRAPDLLALAARLLAEGRAQRPAPEGRTDAADAAPQRVAGRDAGSDQADDERSGPRALFPKVDPQP